MYNNPKIFISYASDDDNFARQLVDKLIQSEISLWVDFHNIRGGKSWLEQIGDAIKRCDIMILLWSQAASNSKWVKLEWENAITIEKQLIPCCLDNTDLPILLNNLVKIDFSDFDYGLSQLMEALPLDIRYNLNYNPSKENVFILPKIQSMIENIKNFFEYHINRNIQPVYVYI